MLVLLLPSNEAKVSTITDPHSCPDVAQGIQANPSLQCPSFFKQLLKSHLSGKFYLSLPKKFCDAHLPSHDGTVVLVDEDEKEYSMKYSVRKHRLCCGWRGFSVAHKLLEGDNLIFNLIEPCKFKVYIVRASKLTEDDEVVGFQAYDFQNIKPISAVKIEDQMQETGKTARWIAVDSHQDKKKPRLISDKNQQMDQLEDIRYSESILYFKDVNSFEDFKIRLNGLILDSEIPTNLRENYYNLCCSQKMFLHDRLIKTISSKLAIAIISETTEIADFIRSANLATSLHSLECWEKTLKAFDDLGMTVGFLRDRLLKLISLSREYELTVESKRIRRAQADEEISILEATSVNVRTLVGIIEDEVEALELKNEKLGFEFQGLAGTPW